MRRLLLISNSTQHGGGYLDHCAAEMLAFLGEIHSVLFVPYALYDRDRYAARAAERFAHMGIEATSLHRTADPAAAIENAASLFVGGGNTFRLLRELYDLDLLAPLRRAVESGTPYMGASAGANIAGRTIGTTNDMPIVRPPTFEALGLVPFNLNPHYLDPDPSSTHRGETREERIAEFLEENDLPVVGLREGAMLRIEGEAMTLLGSTGARLFSRRSEPREEPPGARLDFLLAAHGET